VNIRHSALAVLVAVLWGVNFVAIDLGLHPEGAHDVPPLLFVAMRFVLVVVPCIFFIRKPDVSWKVILGVGLFMSTGQFGLLYVGMALGMPAGLASLVLQAQVLLTVLIAAGVLGERPSGRQVTGVVLGVAGLAVVAVGRSMVAPVLPFIIVLAAALSWAVGNVIVRKAKATSGLGLVVWSGALVPLPLAGLSLLMDGSDAVAGTLMNLQPATVVSAIYTAVFASLVGFGLWNRLLSMYPSSAVVPFTLLVPVVGMSTAWLVLNEVPSPAEVAGGVLLLGGVATAVLGPVGPLITPGQRRWHAQRRDVAFAAPTPLAGGLGLAAEGVRLDAADDLEATDDLAADGLRAADALAAAEELRDLAVDGEAGRLEAEAGRREADVETGRREAADDLRAEGSLLPEGHTAPAKSTSNVAEPDATDR
jgi:O-acetylserine/cysteine efflux transporter